MKGIDVKVNVCGVPFEMSIVDNCVLFSDKSGFWGYSARYIWTADSGLWYLDSMGGQTAGCHLRRMLELLEEHVAKDHDACMFQKDYSLAFRHATSDSA